MLNFHLVYGCHNIVCTERRTARAFWLVLIASWNREAANEIAAFDTPLIDWISAKNPTADKC
jgi:hypothetical protein